MLRKAVQFYSMVLHNPALENGSVSVRDCLLASLVALLWGFNFVVIDWGMVGVPPLLFLAIRFTLVVLPAIFFVSRPPASWRTIALVGTFMSLGQFSLLYGSIAAGMPPGLAGLVLQAQVVFTILIAAGALKEIPTRWQLAGAVIGTLGLIVVALGRGGDTPLGALLLCVAAALSWGIGNVLSRASKVAGGLSLTVWSALVVPVPALALSFVLDGPSEVRAGLAAFGWHAALSTIYTAVLASLVGYGIFNTLLSRNQPSAVVPWILLVPPVAIVSAWLCLGDGPNGAELGGGAVMLLGVIVTLRPRRTRVAPVALDEPLAARL